MIRRTRSIALAAGLGAALALASLPAGEPPLEPLLPTGRVDPYVDCRARGGDFDIAARVCRLPPGGTAPWAQTADD